MKEELGQYFEGIFACIIVSGGYFFFSIIALLFAIIPSINIKTANALTERVL